MSILSVTEIIKPDLDSLAAIFARHYTDYGNKFINCFRKFKSYRMAIGFTVKNFEVNVAPYERDEKIESYVDGLKMPEVESKLLKRVLVMIKLITN